MENSVYNVLQISENSWRIEDKHVRSFLFTGDRTAILIDTGFGTGDIKACAESLTDLPITLVNSHADPDHIGCNAAFDAALMHPSEFAYYAFRAGKEHAVSPLWEGDVIDLGVRSFEVFLIPGHTPGSIALLDRENRILLSGDTVADSPVFCFGDHRSVPAMIESLKKLEAMSDLYDTIYPSHGSFPLQKEAATAQRAAAELLLAGSLEPREPLQDIPAKMYVCGSVSFYI